MLDSLLIPKREPQIITVGGSDSHINGFDSDSIRTAVDVLRIRGGGTIKLSEGVYDIFAPIRLYDNMTLSGAGEKTVLRKCDSVKTDLRLNSDLGELKIEVSDTSGFKIGMAARVTNIKNRTHFTDTIITMVEGKTLHVDRNLLQNYSVGSDVQVTNLCPVVEIVDVRGVKVLNLTIDGNGVNNRLFDDPHANPAAVFINRAADCLIENLKIFDCYGDGVCWATNEDITVRNCDISNCIGFGVHAGSGSVRTLVEGCSIYGNDIDGIYLCWRVQHSSYRNNKTYRNRGNGISIGWKDTDNLFESNHIYENVVSGVYFRAKPVGCTPDNNTFKGNVIEDNGSNEDGYGVFFNYREEAGVVKGSEFDGNTIRDTGKNRQRVGIQYPWDISGIKIGVNEMSGHTEGDIVNKQLTKPNWPKGEIL